MADNVITFSSSIKCQAYPRSYCSELYIEERKYIYFVGFTIIAILSFVSNSLSLQTFLCSRDVRMTNLGVYLITFSISSLFLSFFEAIRIGLIYYYEDEYFSHSVCLLLYILPNTFYTPYVWFWISLAVERALIQCFNYNLFGSLRRAVISLACALVLTILLNLPHIFGQTNSTNRICAGHLTDRAQLTVTILIGSFNASIFILFLISNVLVLRHLTRRRSYLLGIAQSLGDKYLIWLKHRDFFISPSIYPILMLPFFFFYNTVML